MEKLKKYKLTKPEIFGPSYPDITQSPVAKQWHKQDITDYFNYGFNEHTLQIYIHKITQLSMLQREQRFLYADKCEKCENTIFGKAKSLNSLTKENHPIDLGGLFLNVDEELIKFQTDINCLYESNDTRKYSFTEQYRCSGEQMLYRSKFLIDLQKHIKSRTKSMMKSIKNIYMFDQAAKIFPEEKKLPITFPIRERSRTPKKKRNEQFPFL